VSVCQDETLGSHLWGELLHRALIEGTARVMYAPVGLGRAGDTSPGWQARRAVYNSYPTLLSLTYLKPTLLVYSVRTCLLWASLGNAGERLTNHSLSPGIPPFHTQTGIYVCVFR